MTDVIDDVFRCYAIIKMVIQYAGPLDLKKNKKASGNRHNLPLAFLTHEGYDFYIFLCNAHIKRMPHRSVPGTIGYNF